MKAKKRQFGHSEKELWVINCMGCPYLDKFGKKPGFCTNKWNNQNNAQHRLAHCRYDLCPIKLSVAYEDYEQDEDEY